MCRLSVMANLDFQLDTCEEATSDKELTPWTVWLWPYLWRNCLIANWCEGCNTLLLVLWSWALGLSHIRSEADLWAWEAASQHFFSWVACPVSFNDALWLESEINPFPFMLFWSWRLSQQQKANKDSCCLLLFVCSCVVVHRDQRETSVPCSITVHLVLVWQCTETRERHQYLFCYCPPYFLERGCLTEPGAMIMASEFQWPSCFYLSQCWGQVYMASCGCSCSPQSK